MRKRVRIPNILWVADGVADVVTDGIVDGTIQTLDEAGKDPKHRLRRQFDDAVAEFIRDLEQSDKYAHLIEEMRNKFITGTGVSDFLNSVWQNFKSELRIGLADPGSELRRRLVGLVGGVGLALQKDATFRRKLDERIISSATFLARSNGHEIGAMIRGKFQSWDPTTAAKMLEERIGEDLQYIRINGALVGGLVGLVLYFIDRLMLA